MFGIGWRLNYLWEDQRVKLVHKGYVFCVMGFFIPIPLTLLIGEGSAEKVAIDDKTFDMRVTINHKLWGEIYRYQGRFVVGSST